MDGKSCAQAKRVCESWVVSRVLQRGGDCFRHIFDRHQNNKEAVDEEKDAEAKVQPSSVVLTAKFARDGETI